MGFVKKIGKLWGAKIGPTPFAVLRIFGQDQRVEGKESGLRPGPFLDIIETLFDRGHS